MKLGSILLMMLVAAAVCVVKSSLLTRQSIFHARLPEPCFTSRAEDRPIAYPLITFLTRLKDVLMRGASALAENTRRHKLSDSD